MNVQRTTPKGLETPQYEVVRVIEGAIKLGTPERIEIRRYEPFVVAQTSMKMSGDSGGSGTTAGGNASVHLLAIYSDATKRRRAWQ